jgi:predicted MPP superfamily phosphohydrolase
VACLGNHDGGSWIAARGGPRELGTMIDFLNSAGIDVLVNQSRIITLGGRDLIVGGAGDLWTEHFQPDRLRDALPRTPHPPVVLLSHNPDSKDALRDLPWDLMLSGHTHGGQLVLPGLGTPFAPVRDQRFVSGLHEWEGRQIHITRGVGNLHGVRFNCRPEVSLLELVAG